MSNLNEVLSAMKSVVFTADEAREIVRGKPSAEDYRGKIWYLGDCAIVERNGHYMLAAEDVQLDELDELFVVQTIARSMLSLLAQSELLTLTHDEFGALASYMREHDIETGDYRARGIGRLVEVWKA